MAAGGLVLVGHGVLHRLAMRLQLPWPERRTAAMALALFTWLPLVLLAAWNRQLLGSPGALLADVATYVRFWLALPLLASMREPIARELRARVVAWEETLLHAPARQSHRRLVDTLARWANSGAVAALTAALAYALAIADIQLKDSMHVAHWSLGEPGPSPAGLWYALVSAPLLYTFVLRWVLGFTAWAVLLVRLATLPLRLLASHPDGRAGLAGVMRSQRLFAPLAFAASSLLAGGVANYVLRTDATLDDIQMEVVAAGVVLLGLFLGPLLPFTPSLLLARFRFVARFGEVAARHAAQFETRVRQIEGAAEGAAALQPDELEAYANLSAIYENVRSMSGLLIDRKTAVLFAVAIGLPLVCVGLTELPLWQLLSRMKLLMA